ncbi:hypothetical protein FRC10_005842, partial [Ceratobasidium sp. 414]
MKCKITCTPAPHATWFTVEELAWLETFLPEITKLTKTSGKGSGKARTSLYNKVLDKFAEKFPYRHPEAHPEYEFTDQQKALAMEPNDHTQLRSRIRSKLSLASRNERSEGSAKKPRVRKARGPRSTKGGGDSVPSPPPSVDDEDSDSSEQDDEPEKTEGSARKERRGTTRVAKASLPAILEKLGPRYGTSKWDKDDMNFALRWMGEMVEQSWAEVDEVTLRERQGQLHLNVEKLVGLLQHAMGAEVSLNAVYHDGARVQIASACSSGFDGFGKTKEAKAGQEGVYRFAKKAIGERLFTAREPSLVVFRTKALK